MSLAQNGLQVSAFPPGEPVCVVDDIQTGGSFHNHENTKGLFFFKKKQDLQTKSSVKQEHHPPPTPHQV